MLLGGHFPEIFYILVILLVVAAVVVVHPAALVEAQQLSGYKCDYAEHERRWCQCLPHVRSPWVLRNFDKR